MAELAQTTHLVQLSRNGDSEAARTLLPLVYEELRRIARQILRHQAGQTLQPTALVHEAFVKLVDQTRCDFADRAHFAAVASRAMRQILIDHSRAKRAFKRGGGRERVALSDPVDSSTPMLDILALDEALRELDSFDQRQAQVVELRFFGGLSVKETAEVLGVSERTIELDWRMARGWLSRRLSDSDGKGA